MISVKKLSPDIEEVKVLFAKDFPEAYAAIVKNATGRTVALAMYEAFKKGYLAASEKANGDE